MRSTARALAYRRRSAPSGDVSRLAPAAKLERLIAVAKGSHSALVLSHDNPDPDSIASAAALAYLFTARTGMECAIAYGGIIGRAENRAMLKVLKIPAVPVSRVMFDEYGLVAMVDTQPAVGNHSLPQGQLPDVCIDHHPAREGSELCSFADVEGTHGATSTMLLDYLRASRAQIPPDLATALFYGIKADTRDLERETTPGDVSAYLYLFPKVDKDALADIEHPSLPARYFAVYHQGIERARVFSSAVIVDLGEVYSPDLVAEVAERKLALESMKWSLAIATFRGHLYASLRTSDRRMNAGKLMRDLTSDMGGSSGGHGSMAGARLPMPHGRAARTAFKKDLLARFKHEFGVTGPGTPLLGLDAR